VAHTCDRTGPPAKAVDASSDEPSAATYPTCSVCGKPQVGNGDEKPAIPERRTGTPALWFHERVPFPFEPGFLATRFGVQLPRTYALGRVSEIHGTGGTNSG
jgi:hypothetical protein